MLAPDDFATGCKQGAGEMQPGAEYKKDRVHEVQMQPGSNLRNGLFTGILRCSTTPSAFRTILPPAEKHIVHIDGVTGSSPVATT